jgi:hypothetical protein
VARGIEKHGSPLFPILCICGGITVIGAGTFVSHFDEVSGGFPAVSAEVKAKK